MILFYLCGVVVIILYILFDVNYFLKSLFIIVWARLFVKKKLSDTSTIYGICTTNDIDVVFTHMNNARYLRELDFARTYFYAATGFYSALLKNGLNAFQTASFVRYRQAILIFTPYRITTKLIYWHDKHFYMEQRFIGFTDNVVYAVVLNRQTIIGNVSIQDIFADLEQDMCRPKPTKELKLWLETIQESSERLRKQRLLSPSR